MQQAVEYCGLRVIKDKCLCPFHKDQHPSMKIYPDGKGYLFNVTMPGYNTDNTSQNISEKEQKKIDKAVQKAFQGLEPANGDGMMMDGASADIGNKDMTMDNAAQNGATFSTEETVEAR